MVYLIHIDLLILGRSIAILLDAMLLLMVTLVSVGFVLHLLTSLHGLLLQP
jgi:hypothetical protein